MIGFFIFLVSVYSCAYSEDIDNNLLYRTEGVVGRENFTHYKVQTAGTILIVLKTVHGDADIYVSQKSFVSYNPSEYDLHSATCGIDSVEVPKNFKKPVSIGIYGHPSYEESSFILEIYDFPDNTDNSNDLIIETIEIPRHESKETTKNDKKMKAKIKSFSTKTGLWAMFEVFQLIFL